jgi:hypothetical protein
VRFEKHLGIFIRKEVLSQTQEGYIIKHVTLHVLRDIYFLIMNEIFHDKNVQVFLEENAQAKLGIK